VTALDWVFVALLILALALVLGWLDAPVALSRAASRIHRPHLPQWMRNSYAQARIRHELRRGR
jgi:hypothetical protein